jgi:UDP-N-acetylglucosamine acyltransferase
MIDPSAIIDKKAVVDVSADIGAYVVIEDGVHIGKNVTINPYAHIKGNTIIGDDSFIGTGAVIGELPQMLGQRDNIGKLRIGKNVTIREYVTVHVSTSQEKETVIGDNCFLMAFSHVGHDCVLANDVVVCNNSSLAGHVEVAERAFISGTVVVHQFVRIGRLAMVSGLARVNQDIPPFMLVVGDSRVWGINTVGIKRSGMSTQDLSEIKKAFTVIYRKNLSIKNALAQLEKEELPLIKELVVFILASKRGVCGPKKSSLWERLFLDYPYFVRAKLTDHLNIKR